MHTVRDDAETVKREETEIFVPGQGDLRTTQPDQQNQDPEQEHHQ